MNVWFYSSFLLAPAFSAQLGIRNDVVDAYQMHVYNRVTKLLPEYVPDVIFPVQNDLGDNAILVQIPGGKFYVQLEGGSLEAQEDLEVIKEGLQGIISRYGLRNTTFRTLKGWASSLFISTLESYGFKHTFQLQIMSLPKPFLMPEEADTLPEGFTIEKITTAEGLAEFQKFSLDKLSVAQLNDPRNAFWGVFREGQCHATLVIEVMDGIAELEMVTSIYHGLTTALASRAIRETLLEHPNLDFIVVSEHGREVDDFKGLGFKCYGEIEVLSASP